MVGLHPPEAVLTRHPDVTRRQPAVVRPLRHRSEELRREDDLVPPAAALGEPPADDRLGGASALVTAVAVRCVEEVDPELDRAIHDRERLVLGRLRPEVHRPETQLADLESGAAQSSIAHGPSLADPGACARRRADRRPARNGPIGTLRITPPTMPPWQLGSTSSRKPATIWQPSQPASWPMSRVRSSSCSRGTCTWLHDPGWAAAAGCCPVTSCSPSHRGHGDRDHQSRRRHRRARRTRRDRGGAHLRQRRRVDDLARRGGLYRLTRSGRYQLDRRAGRTTVEHRAPGTGTTSEEPCSISSSVTV